MSQNFDCMQPLRFKNGTRVLASMFVSLTEAAFSHQGPKIWNELPFSIRSLTSVAEFKSSLKTHYFDQAFYEVD